MHLPSHKLQLRPKLATVLQHPTNTSTSAVPETSAPVKTHSSLNIKDKRNIKIGIVALRTVSKWTDKAALTLEKLEGQDTSNHCQERQARLNKENGSKVDGKGVQNTGVWRETVVYPVPAQVGVSREIEGREQPQVYRESPPFSKEESYGTVKTAEMSTSKACPVRVLTPVVEYYNESSDDEDEEKDCKEVGQDTDTDVHTDTDEDSSDVSSDEEEEEEDGEDEKESHQDSDNETDSEEEAETKHPVDSHVKK